MGLINVHPVTHVSPTPSPEPSLGSPTPDLATSPMHRRLCLTTMLRLARVDRDVLVDFMEVWDSMRYTQKVAQFELCHALYLDNNDSLKVYAEEYSCTTP